MCVSTWVYIEGKCFPAHGPQENYASRPYHMTFKGGSGCADGSDS